MGGLERGCDVCFNPRRPVSRPATRQMQYARRWAAVSIHADRFPGRRPGAVGVPAQLVHVSIHADRFPGRRPNVATPPGSQLMFQSTPTGFPAGDQRLRRRHRRRGRFNPRRPVSRPATQCVPEQATVSIHADRFPGRRRRRAGLRGSRWRCFNPRRPVSRPATRHERHPSRVRVVSIHADRFPGRRLNVASGVDAFVWFQSTPTGFPAGDGRPSARHSPAPSFNPRRPVSRPATLEAAGRSQV